MKRYLFEDTGSSGPRFVGSVDNKFGEFMELFIQDKVDGIHGDLSIFLA